MYPQDTLTLTYFKGLFNTRGTYILGYSCLYGMSVWVTFFAGVIAYRALPRQQFRALQLRIFPVYFTVSLCISSVLLFLWVFDHPNVLTRLGNPLVVDVAQVYALASVIWFQGVNHFVVGPMTSEALLQRQKLEKAEGSSNDNTTVTEEMKTLNARFGMLHGISSLANLGAVIVLTFHGLCLGV